MQWYVDVLKKYTVFTGRAGRQEFWMFALINFVIVFVLAALSRFLTFFSVIYILYCLAVLLPSIGVTIRRLHDTGRSGYWWLIGLVPCIGTIVLIVFCAMEGEAGDNQYGPRVR